ncbi:hypothetical protein LTR95_007420 [Oleoguttula sp. CCFEE 5521]
MSHPAATLFNRAVDLSAWPIKDILYVAIVGSVMLAALVEWFLWLLAFTYCLMKVFQKAEGKGKWGIRTLALANMIFFVVMRVIFLPIMVVTLPMPAEVTKQFPESSVAALQWFVRDCPHLSQIAFWSFAGLLVIPWLFCVFQLVTHNIGRSRRIKYVLDEHTAPKMVIVMPCYHEPPDILLRTVDSIVDCEYPPSCLHVFLSFDGEQEDELYLNTLAQLGVPMGLDTSPRSIDVVYRSCRITVSRFPHGGKRCCQKKTFKLIDRIYEDYLRRHDNMFILFIDSDCILDKHCIQNFMYEMELKPGSSRNILAQTGIITSTTPKHNLLTVLQDMEYIHGQLFERTVESGCGAVTCLPGALTVLRFSAFRKVAKFYFADKAEHCEDMFDYGKSHLGEDRWLTHLFMIACKKRYQIQINTGAFCKTDAVQTFATLLKQRRRWFLGFITNEACMLTDIRLWKRYPLLLLLRLGQNTIRTTALLFFIMVISLVTTSQKVTNLPVGFIAVSLGLNWLLMLYFGARLGRYKIMLYPLMFVVNPFFNWLYMVYGICTAGQRTWGGPRADAGKADEKTPAETVVAEAKAAGDDLNVVPETFKSALAEGLRRETHTPLLPPDRLEGRFAPAEEMPGGWYRQSNDSGRVRANLTLRDHTPPGSRSGSWDSFYDPASARSSMRPRRVERIVGFDAMAAYRQQQLPQRPAGGAYFEAARPPFGPFDGPYGRDDFAQPRDHSRESLASNDSVPMHFGVPGRLPSPAPRTYSPTPQGYSDTGLHPPPPAAYIPGSSIMQNGRSPLARKSFTRLATLSPELGSGEVEVELEVRVPSRGDMRRDRDGYGSSGEERGRRVERRGRRGRRSFSVDGDGRRRLSKARKGSNESKDRD